MGGGPLRWVCLPSWDGVQTGHRPIIWECTHGLKVRHNMNHAPDEMLVKILVNFTSQPIQARCRPLVEAIQSCMN